tara:strand:- start:138 stop:410 length:273 start_codon:yes stop_codon:yes gene_type:complete
MNLDGKKSYKLSNKQSRRFLALSFVGFNQHKQQSVPLCADVEDELIKTKMIQKAGDQIEITERGLKEIARLATLAGIVMPWEKSNGQAIS